MSYLETPVRSANNWPLFAELLHRGQSEVVRCALVGDSRATCPAGLGVYLSIWLNALAAQIYGNCPETPLLIPHSTETEYWCAAANWPTPDGLEGDRFGKATLHGGDPSGGRIDADQLPPGSNPIALSALDADDNSAGSYGYGMLFTLRPDNSGSATARLGIPELAFSNVFDATGGVDARIYGVTYPSSGEVRWRSRPTIYGTPYYFSAVAASGTTAMGLESPTHAVKTETIRLAYNAAAPFSQIELSVPDTTKRATLLGARFASVAKPYGMVWDLYGVGGHRSTHLLANHGNCWDVLRAMEYSLLAFCYGANDVPLYSAAQFADNMRANLDRAFTEIPSLLVPVFANPWMDGLSTENQAIYDDYAGALAEAVLEYDRASFVNVYRMATAAGYNAQNNSTGGVANESIEAWAEGQNYVADNLRKTTDGNQTRYWRCTANHLSEAANRPPSNSWRQIRIHSADGVHDTAAGARVVAQSIYAGLFGAPVATVASLTSQERADVAAAVVAAQAAQLGQISADIATAKAAAEAAQAEAAAAKTAALAAQSTASAQQHVTIELEESSS